VIAVVGELEERQGAPLQRHGDAHGGPLGSMIAHPHSGGQRDVPHRPVDGESEPAGGGEGGEDVGDEGDLDGEGIDPVMGEETPEPLNAVQEVVFRVDDAPCGGRRIRTRQGGEEAGTLGKQGPDEQREVRRLGGGEDGQGALDGGEDAGIPWQGKASEDQAEFDTQSLSPKALSVQPLGGYASGICVVFSGVKTRGGQRDERLLVMRCPSFHTAASTESRRARRRRLSLRLLRTRPREPRDEQAAEQQHDEEQVVLHARMRGREPRPVDDVGGEDDREDDTNRDNRHPLAP